MFAAGQTVVTIREVMGMAVGAEGIVIGWYTNTLEVLVRFWDGGPLRVPADAVTPVGGNA